MTFKIDFGNKLLLEIGKNIFLRKIVQIYKYSSSGKVKSHIMEKVFSHFPSFLQEKRNRIINFKIFLCFASYQVKASKHALQALPVQDQLFNASRLPSSASVLPQRLQQVATQPSPAL